ncbi:speedy protein 1-B-like [Ascaphus truei]|uniref:speedy protein 1-B-like n=1 Tax=Ascaphus truei TaxID=8439 RepID=UPI003F5AC4DE
MGTSGCSRRALQRHRTSGAQETEDPAEEDTMVNIHPPVTIEPAQRTAFYQLFEDDIIRAFLGMDSCLKISDKYLLAMVLAYFQRAGLRIEEYTRRNFFVALFLANDMEEDEHFKEQIYLWALGRTWYRQCWDFKRTRDMLWARMGYKALVTQSTCEQIMADNPSHWAWRRERKDHHGWAIRFYLRRPEEFCLRGPGNTPPQCPLCNIFEENARSSRQSQPARWEVIGNIVVPAGAALALHQHRGQ